MGIMMIKEEFRELEPSSYTISSREVTDLRGAGASLVVDEYADDDPYPKGEEREKNLHNLTNSVILKLIPELNNKSCNILDAGCGTGDWIDHIISQSGRDDHNVNVAEYSPKALGICLHRNKFISQAFLFDANNYPFNKNLFDVILSINVFEHIESPTSYLRGCIDSLKPGGVLLLSTPSRYRFGNMIRVFLGKDPALIHDLHVTEYTVAQVYEMTRFAGGEVKSVKGAVLTAAGQKFEFLSSILSPAIQFIFSKILNNKHLLHKTVFYRIEKKPDISV